MTGRLVNPDFALQRTAMVDSQLRTVGVNDPAVLEAIAATPRERFMPAGRAALAYADGPVVLVPGRTMIEPMIIGLLLTYLRVMPGERMLIIGAGTGYSAAVSAVLTPQVIAVEADPALAAFARAALADTPGVTVVEGPLVAGAVEHGPYDIILIDGAVELLPPALLSQLFDGGRIGAVIYGADGVASATVGRVVGGHFGGNTIIETGGPVLPGFERAKSFVF
jgi:protein-L-isoaspartate(D-aspartate) O-methyltransferase